MDQSSELNLMMEESNSCDKPNQLGDPEWKFIESFRTENDYTSYLANYTHKMTTSKVLKNVNVNVIILINTSKCILI